MKRAEEDDRVLGSATSNVGYKQQLSNIDIIFNFFLWCKVAGVEKKDQRKLNAFLNILGMQIQGKQKVKQALLGKNCVLRSLSGYLNQTGGVHMPPFAITTSRIYDMVAVYGLLRWDCLGKSLAEPGVSDRLSTHLLLDNSSAIAFIISLFQLETAAKIGTNGIMQSEHLFHQLLMSKRSCYENATKRKGDVFGIELIAASSTNPRSTGGKEPGSGGPPPTKPKPSPQPQPGTSKTPTIADILQTDYSLQGQWEQQGHSDYEEQLSLATALETVNDAFNIGLLEAKEKALISAKKKSETLENTIKTLISSGILTTEKIGQLGLAPDITAVLEDYKGDINFAEEFKDDELDTGNLSDGSGESYSEEESEDEEKAKEIDDKENQEGQNVVSTDEGKHDHGKHQKPTQ